ncbi:hypothetical protein G7L33_26670, partial [Klebsiella quasipneumoniae]|nr:hypothetical protein [Klebsiella quasipneumoniae]
GPLSWQPERASGQLVQETYHFASVRGARIVLLDDDGPLSWQPERASGQLVQETYHFASVRGARIVLLD